MWTILGVLWHKYFFLDIESTLFFSFLSIQICVRNPRGNTHRLLSHTRRVKSFLSCNGVKKYINNDNPNPLFVFFFSVWCLNLFALPSIDKIREISAAASLGCLIRYIGTTCRAYHLPQSFSAFLSYLQKLTEKLKIGLLRMARNFWLD